jgi:hypothetical protein
MPNDQVFGGTVDPFGLGEEPLFYFTRVFLIFLQGLFEQFPTGSYKWSIDEKITEIEITDQVPIPRTRIEQKPQIVTMRGPAQFGNLTLDQMREVDPKTGAKVRTDLVACTMTLNCIARNGLEAQRLAWIVARHIRTFKRSLQAIGKMHKVGDELAVGPESPPGSFVEGEVDPEWSLVTVQAPFFFQWTEKDTSLNSPLLRAIEAKIKSAELPQAATTTQGSVDARAMLSAPTIRGRVISQVNITDLGVGIITQTVKT